MSCAQVMYQPYAPNPYMPPPQGDTLLQHHHQEAYHLQHLHSKDRENRLQDVALQRESGLQRGGSSFRSSANGSPSEEREGPPEKKLFTEADCAAGATISCGSSRQAGSQALGITPGSHHSSPPVLSPSTSSQQNTSGASPSVKTVKYMSANCVVVTHYQGNTSAVVDEHFSRALYEKPTSPSKATSPMSSRNFPPSFWNYQVSAARTPSLASHLAGATSSMEIYDPYHSGFHHLAATQGHHEHPWAYSLSSQTYGQRAHDMYQAAMSSPSRSYYQYPSLSFQPHLSRLPTMAAVSSQMPPPMGKSDSGWNTRYHDHFGTAADLSHGLDPSSYSVSHYANVPGLEAGVPQDGAKDLYWF